MMYNIVLTRHDENVAILVSVDSMNDANINQVMDSVKKAITKWVNSTLEGEKAWKGSSECLNMGDIVWIAETEDMQSLIPFLEEEGLYQFSAEIYGDSEYAASVYTIDTVLYEKEGE